MGKEKKIRVLAAKPGLDGHDRGVKVVASGVVQAGDHVASRINDSGAVVFT